MRPETLARAIELDDPYPDNVCPGCQQDITGWRSYDHHYPRDVELSWHYSRYGRKHLPWPFGESKNGSVETCEWTRDYLAARRFRRRFIAKHTEVVA